MPDAGPASVAVLPLRAIGGAGAAGEAVRVAEELTAALIVVPGLVVRSARRADEAVGQGGDADRIGRRLGVSYVVDGSVQRGPARLRVTLRLVRAADAVSVWAGTFDAAEADPIAAAQAVAAEAGGQIGRRVAERP
jgi:TolB-like protein